MSKSSRKMILNRNHTMTSTYGHSVRFVKDQPVHVPPALYHEALAIGALFADGETLEVEVKNEDGAPTDPQARSEAIYKAVVALVERNDVDDFTAAGSPKVDAVTRAAGFKVVSKEIATAWQTHHDRKAEEQDAD